MQVLLDFSVTLSSGFDICVVNCEQVKEPKVREAESQVEAVCGCSDIGIQQRRMSKQDVNENANKGDISKSKH